MDETVKHQCFRCGAEYEKEEDIGSVDKCEGCGEIAVISLKTACDILNDIYLKGDLHLGDYIIE